MTDANPRAIELSATRNLDAADSPRRALMPRERLSFLPMMLREHEKFRWMDLIWLDFSRRPRRTSSRRGDSQAAHPRGHCCATTRRSPPHRLYSAPRPRLCGAAENSALHSSARVTPATSIINSSYYPIYYLVRRHRRGLLRAGWHAHLDGARLRGLLLLSLSSSRSGGTSSS